jgi:hypothetical protein
MNTEELKQHLISIVIHGANPSTELANAIAIEYKKIFPEGYVNLNCGSCLKDMCRTLYNYYYAGN